MKEYERLTISTIRLDDDRRAKEFYICGVTIYDLYNRLAELEDDLESGKMIRLPCKVGDIVYYVNRYKQTIEEYEVLEFTICHNYTVLVGIGNGMCLYANEIILTKAEAENKLKQLKGE